MDGWKVLFEFFEKTMATNLMVEADSALSREVKLSTLSEEITRKLRNTSLEGPCVKMKTSGHSEQFIRQAVEQGIRSYEDRVMRSKLETSHPGYQPLYPKAGWRKDIRSKEKAMKRGTWKELSKTTRNM